MIRLALPLMMLLVPAQVRAADARELFQSGSKALQAGKADEALKDFEEAYAAQPAPSLLFYIGEAHRALGHRAKAEQSYRKYIEAQPGGPKIAEAKKRFAELRAQAASEEANAPQTKAAPESAKKKRRRKKESGKPSLEAVDLDGGTPAPVLPAAEPAKPIAAAPAPAPAPAPAEPTPPAAVAAAPVTVPPPMVVAAAPVAVPASTPRAVERTQLSSPRTPVLATAGPDSLRFASYTGRLLVVQGSAMRSYASYGVGKTRSALYTHGFAFGKQGEQFKNAVYVGFGTEWAAASRPSIATSSPGSSPGRRSAPARS